MPFLGESLHMSSWPRRFLGNLRPSRARSGTRRTLTRPELEARLETLLANQGEQALNRLATKRHWSRASWTASRSSGISAR
jgi:hypothetical protein